MLRTFHLFIVSLLVVITLGLILYNHFPSLFYGQSHVRCPRCNIVIIDIDTLRADAVSCLGSARNVTPNMCGLAKNGVLFEKNITTSEWTLPSIFSTFTSQYPSTHGVFDYQLTLSTMTKTMPELFKSVGYRTLWVGQIGSWVVSRENGGLRGFDRVITDPDAGIPLWEKIADEFLTEKNDPAFIYLYEGGKLHVPYVLGEGESPLEDIEKPRDFPVTRGEFFEKLSDFLRLHAKDIFTDRAKNEHPELFQNVQVANKYDLLKYYLSIDPHLDPTHPYLRDNWIIPQIDVYREFIISDDQEDQRRRIAYARMLYDTKVFSADRELSPLLELLSSPKFTENTIIVLLTDHGEEFMEHGQLNHYRHLYNELLQTPLVIKIPLMLPTRVSDISQNVDVLPTLLDATGLARPRQMQGISLIPLMEGQKQQKTRYAVSQTREKEMSIQDGSWKLISDFSVSPKATELYDLKKDPGERVNLLDKESEKANTLLRILIGMVDKSNMNLSKLAIRLKLR